MSDAQVVSTETIAPEKPLGMRWYKFWTYVRLPVGAVFLALFAFVFALDADSDSAYLALFCGAIAIWYGAVAVGLHLWRRWAWWLNWFAIGFGVFVASVPADPLVADLRGFWASILLIGATYGVASGIYWIRRRHLFGTVDRSMSESP